jgi:hypothetical protein
MEPLPSGKPKKKKVWRPRPLPPAAAPAAEPLTLALARGAAKAPPVTFDTSPPKPRFLVNGKPVGESPPSLAARQPAALLPQEFASAAVRSAAALTDHGGLATTSGRGDGIRSSRSWQAGLRFDRVRRAPRNRMWLASGCKAKGLKDFNGAIHFHFFFQRGTHDYPIPSSSLQLPGIAGPLRPRRPGRRQTSRAPPRKVGPRSLPAGRRFRQPPLVAHGQAVAGGLDAKNSSGSCPKKISFARLLVALTSARDRRRLVAELSVEEFRTAACGSDQAVLPSPGASSAGRGGNGRASELPPSLGPGRRRRCRAGSLRAAACCPAAARPAPPSSYAAATSSSGVASRTTAEAAAIIIESWRRCVADPRRAGRDTPLDGP